MFFFDLLEAFDTWHGVCLFRFEVHLKKQKAFFLGRSLSFVSFQRWSIIFM